MSIAVQVALVMVVLLVLLLAAGVPIGVGIGLSSAVSMICMLPSNVAFATSAQRIFAGSNSFSLIAIPFFILAGNIMNNGGIARRLVNFRIKTCKLCKGHRRPYAWCISTVQCNRKHAFRCDQWFRCSSCCSHRKHHGTAGRGRRL